MHLTPTQLANHLACQHLTQLERQRREGLLHIDFSPDSRLDAMRERGRQHEQAFIETLRREGHTVCELLGWRLVRLLASAIVLVGCVQGGRSVRIITCLVWSEGRRAWTTPGRQYDLANATASEADSLALIEELLAASGHFQVADVTDQFVGGSRQLSFLASNSYDQQTDEPGGATRVLPRP